MFVKEFYRAGRPVVSFEIFPPKPGAPLEGIYRTVEAIRDLEPDFISITYGAGGSTRDLTFEIASRIKGLYGIETMAHLTGLCHTREEIDDIVDDLLSADVRNVLAMRGDPPIGGPAPERPDFPYAAPLIRHLKENYYGELGIAAACYPEGHIECPDPELDLRRLKAKCDEGVDCLVSQLFFDNELFYAFRDRARGIGVTQPISAGIFPILNKNQVTRILGLCGVAFPPKFTRLLARYGEDPASLAEAGIAYATDQIVDLLASGIEGIHLYTMNRPETTRRILDNIGLLRRGDPAGEARRDA
jgi:methylenetetrahydrofolate reductase (NADPH)